MSDKMRNYLYYAAVIYFFIQNIVVISSGVHYASFVSNKNFAGTKFGMLVYLSAIGGYILEWLGSLGFVIVTYIYKNL